MTTGDATGGAASAEAVIAGLIPFVAAVGIVILVGFLILWRERKLLHLQNMETLRAIEKQAAANANDEYMTTVCHLKGLAKPHRLPETKKSGNKKCA